MRPCTLLIHHHHRIPRHVFFLLNLFRSDVALSLIEVAGLLVAVMIAFLVPGISRAFSLLEAALKTIRISSSQAVLLVFLATLLGRLALLPISPVPVPGIHDEFSYLLAGDTFAHGRLSNPASPVWEHFESFHILQNPTYASMYPPAQGLFLALGQATTGYPWAGVLLSIALLCAAVCWMLQAWMEPGWALAGGLVCTLRFGLASYWVDSYWGGGVAALGGVLVIGSLARAFRRPSFATALLFSAGTFLLSSSRPYEGLVLFLPVISWFLFKLLGPAVPKTEVFLKFGVPAACLLLIAGAWTLFYFSKVTGSPLLMPYQLNEKEYQISRPFVWQQPRAVPVYHHSVMKAYYVEHAQMGNGDHRGPGTFVRECVAKFSALLMFYFWPGIGVVALGTWLAWRAESVRFAFGVFLVVWVGLCLESWPMQLHYSAPILACTVILTMEAVRALYRQTWRDRPVGKCMVGMSLLLCLAATGVRLTADVTQTPVTPFGIVPWATSHPGFVERQKIIDQLETMPGRHLVVVRYSGHHDNSEEWVYNPADLNTARVIFARGMSPTEDRQLVAAFPDCTLWELQPDSHPLRLQRVQQQPILINTARR